MDLGISGKRALVTGGSRGIGRAIALALSAEGVRVCACHVNPDSGAGLSEQLEPAGGFVFRADVSRPDEVDRLADAVRERFGGLDIVVNNAGVVSHHPAADMDPAEWHRVLDSNLTSCYLVTRAVTPMLAEGAVVINISSGVALVGQPGLAHYTAAKAGILGLTRTLSKELGPRKVRVNAISPGVVETDQAADAPPERRAAYAARTALGRIGRPEDIAGACLLLVSDLAGFITGANLAVDGGLS